MKKMPIWLSSDGTEKARLMATSLSIDLNINSLPRATLVMPSNLQEIPGLHEIIRLDDLGLFRVVSSTYLYNQTVSLQLIGAADTLSDDLYDVAASEEETKTATQWITAILAKQTSARWQLGTCDMSSNVTIKTNYQDLWTLMENIRESQKGYWWGFDFSTSPWTISLKALPSAIVSEFRLSRNVESAQISVSDQDLCNKLIFTVSDAETPTPTAYNDTTSQAKYGIRTRCTDIKTDEIPDGMTAAQYAQQILSDHSRPIISIVITGEDLYQLTGDSFDQIELGSLCRAVLPDYDDDPIEERVVSLTWTDAINEPMRLKVSLSTEIQAITGSLASAKAVAAAVKKSGGGGGGGGGAKADADGWAKVLTEVIEAVDGTGIEQLWQSGIAMTATGGVKIFTLYQGMESLNSAIDVNKESITQEVTRATGAEGVLDGKITVQAGKIALVVTETAGGNVINAASIVAAINSQSGSSSVKISADQIDLDGYVTASQLSTLEAQITNLTTGVTTAGSLRANNLYGGSFSLNGHAHHNSTITIDGVNYNIVTWAS